MATTPKKVADKIDSEVKTAWEQVKAWSPLVAVVALLYILATDILPLIY